ncbi:hypothetical protein B0H17DRAFT_1334889 [Mycena rosella]|uniref:Uncharacterized protein n=1 Tax=Mycena rosella TaxID=1033263 RepID=A0AAD7GBT6_MYCRO|nr:hypothetical protein B0H17DRAFT_1334889 [Mycena rosella]
MRCSLAWLASVLSLFLLCSAKTIIIDDQAGDPTNGNTITYTPTNLWISDAIGGCSGCPGPSPDLAYMNTWHGAVFNSQNKNRNAPSLTASVNFYGTSVWVTCIMSNSLTTPIGTSNMKFFLDGADVGNFSYNPTGAGGFVPNTIVFTSEALNLTWHTLVIENGVSSTSLTILDSISYSTPDDAPPAIGSAPSEAVLKSPSNVAAIVGAVFAILAVLLLLGLAFLYVRHRQNKHRSNVPLSTTMAAPLGRLRSLWSAPPRPPPDMAPVPFPSPVQHVSRPPAPAPSPSPSPSPRPPPATPASPPSRRSRLSRMSFNPNLLVGRLHRARAPPAPITTLQPPDTRAASPALRSGNPLLREPSAQVEPHDVMTSIQQWQLRTLQEAASQPPIHPLDMSEVDLSSHYDSTGGGDSSAPPPPPPAPPPRSPQPPQRRFTVMNN